MKSLFVTLLILSGVFLGYDYFLAAPGERLVFKRTLNPGRGMDPTAVIPHEIEDGDPVSSIPVADKAPTSDAAIKIPALPSKDFVPPVLPSLEELTQNWVNIPAHAFPREVKLRKFVDVKMAAGSARIPAGAPAYARSAENGWLTVAPTPTSTAWGRVPLGDTDIQDQIRGSYARWKNGRIEQARQAWLAKKTAKPMTNVTVNDPVSTAGALDSAGRPMQNNDGTYPLLMASMKAGDVTEISPPKVRRWGKAEQKVIQGQPLWTVDVWYDTVVFCGPIVAQAQARVRDGKVIAWVYPSGEPVP